MRFNRFDAGSLIGGAALLAGVLMFSAGFDANPAMAFYHKSPSPSATAPDTGGEAVEVRLDEWDIGFRTVTVAAGQTTFHIVNDGAYKHAFKIKGPGVEEVAKLIAAGKSTTLTVTLQPGRYEVWCAVKGHKKRGMAGEVVVEG